MSNSIIHEIKAGDKFGNWIVADETPQCKNGRAAHLCECSCSKKMRRVVLDKDLRSGRSKGCGCNRGNGGCNKKLIEAGTAFGSWTVIEASDKRNTSGDILYLCQCVCGIRKLLLGTNLRKGTAQSCGCSRANTSVYIGAVFTRWTVIGATNEKNTQGSQMWLCKCSCEKGTIRKVSSHQLTRASKSSRSCGCINAEAVSKTHTTHGKSNTKEYRQAHSRKNKALYPERYKQYWSARRARKVDAFPDWAKTQTTDAFKDFAHKAHEMEQETGDKYHIDHVIPLKGRAGGEHVVCGLHVWYNLQLLPAKDNMSKNCHHWPDMWDY